MAIDGGLGALFKQRLEPRGFHLQRIETGGTGRGIPDTNAARPDGVEIWIEFKQTEAFSIASLKKNAPQIGWHLRRNRMGCRTWFAVRQQAAQGRRRERRDALWLVHGRHAAALAQGGLTWASERLGLCEDVFCWVGPGPARWDWLQIEQILLR